MILIYGKGNTGKSLQNLANFLRIPSKIIDDSEFLHDFNLKNYKNIIVSPGIPFFHPIFEKSKKDKINIEGEIEFASRYFNGKTIAITGTDGKSTTTKMIYEILKSEKKDVFIGGNYGIPFSEIVFNIIKNKIKNPIVVLELSSFQIYSTKRFKPNIAVFLNFAVDHLDWHKNEKHYLFSKLKIFKNLTEKDSVVLNFDDEIVKNVKTKAKKYFFSLNKLPDSLEGIYLKNKKLVLRMKKEERILFDSDILKLKGTHNLQNMMASVLVGILNNISVEKIQQVMGNFKGLPHRLEFVKNIRGVNFYNDSKATTVQAVEKAISSFDKNVILIIGGINKGGDFSKLNPLLKEKVKKVYLFGKSKEEIKDMISSSVDAELVNSLEESVIKGFTESQKGDTILLSPGCSSFDMFKNYIERGNKFKEIVDSLDIK